MVGTSEVSWDLADTLTSLGELEDDVTLDVKEAFEFRVRSKYQKTPLNESPRYRAFNTVIEALLEGRIDQKLYLENMWALATHQRGILGSLELPVVEKRYAGLGEDAHKLYREMRAAYTRICEGAEMLVNYSRSNNIDDVKEGRRILNEGFVALEKVQSKVVEAGEAQS